MSNSEPISAHQFNTRVRSLGNRQLPAPNIVVNPEAISHMGLFVDMSRVSGCPIGFMGTARKLNEQEYSIDRVMLVDQQVSRNMTVLSPADIDRLVHEMLEQGHEGDLQQLHFFAYSRPFHGTQPCNQDEQTMQAVAQNGAPFFIHGILDQSRRANFTLMDYANDTRVEETPWSVGTTPAPTATYHRPATVVVQGGFAPGDQPAPAIVGVGRADDQVGDIIIPSDAEIEAVLRDQQGGGSR